MMSHSTRSNCNDANGVAYIIEISRDGGQTWTLGMQPVNDLKSGHGMIEMFKKTFDDKFFDPCIFRLSLYTRIVTDIRIETDKRVTGVLEKNDMCVQFGAHGSTLVQPAPLPPRPVQLGRGLGVRMAPDPASWGPEPFPLVLGAELPPGEVSLEPCADFTVTKGESD